MAINEFSQNTVFNNPDLPSGALSSKQFNTIVEAISEGLIEGSATASKAGITDKTSTAYFNAFKKDIFLNSTQILQQAASNTSPQDSDFNFKDVGFDFRLGSSNQTFIDGIKNIETEFIVGTTVTTSTPVTHTVNQSNINAVRATLRFPSMQKFEDNGDINGTEVNLVIKTIENNGTTTTVINDTVKGRSTNAYFRDYLIKLKSTTSFPVQIRVERITADSTDSKLVNAFSFHTATNIIFEQNAYPDTAHVALRFNAEQFPRVPKRVFKIRGIKIKIPTNAQVNLADGSLTYSGTWNGQFKTDKEWCSDPAWILYDLLSNTRYGCSIPETALDKFKFKTVSQYCGEQVDDGSGTGSTEPRFSCNVNITQAKEAYTVINELCSVMRVMPYYAQAGIAISQDAPKNVSYIFNNANITDDGFNYFGSSLDTRHTVINVSYLDMTTQELDIETVEADATTQNKYGIHVKNIKAFATTSRGQASRLGKWFLFNEQNSGETISFTTTIAAGCLINPGDIIGVSDTLKAGVRIGGLLKSVTNTTTVVLDDTANTNIPALSDNPTLSIILPNGSLETKNITAINSGTITVSSAFSQAPNEHAPYILETSALQTTTWRVLSIQENEDLTYTISALEHNSGKYAFVEDNTPLPTRNITTLTQIKQPPSGLQAREQIVVINNKAITKIILDWETQGGVSKYQVQYRANNGDFKTIDTPSSNVEIFNTDVGVYEFRVFSFNGLNQPSRTPATLTFNAIGKTAVPLDVKNVKIEPLNNKFVRLRFDKSTETDVLHGGAVVIRSSNLTSGATFTNSVDVIPQLPGSVSESIVPNIVNGTYLLRFKDDGGRISSGDASVVLISTTPDVLPKLTVLTDREDLDSPPFQGVKDDCFFSDEVNGLVLGSTDLLDDAPDFDAIADFDFIGNVDFLTGGQYFFKSTLDLGGIQPINLLRHFVTQGFYPNDLIDKRTANIDTWSDFDGATAVDVNAKLLVATTNSDPDLSVSATYAISGTTITITKSSHGYSVGGFVTVDFTSGTGVDGDYEIKSVLNANTFTLTSATSLNTSGNCTYSAEFTQYNPFVNGTYVARGFKFRCDLESNDPAQSIEIDQLGYKAEIDSRTETSLGNAGASTGGFIASGTSTKSVTFTNSFFTGQSGTSIAANSVLPSIGITIENAQSGDFFTLSNVTGSGFDIDIKNGSSHVNRNFKYAATGFGRGS